MTNKNIFGIPMLAIATAFLVLVTLLFLSHRKSTVVVFTMPPSSVTAGWITYHDAAYGFSISYPPPLILSTSTGFEIQPPPPELQNKTHLEFYIGPYSATDPMNLELFLPYPPLQILPWECDRDAPSFNTQDIIVNSIVSKGRIVDNSKQRGFIVNFPGLPGKGWSGTCNTITMLMKKDSNMTESQYNEEVTLYKNILSTFHFLP